MCLGLLHWYRDPNTGASLTLVSQGHLQEAELGVEQLGLKLVFIWNERASGSWLNLLYTAGLCHGVSYIQGQFLCAQSVYSRATEEGGDSVGIAGAVLPRGSSMNACCKGFKAIIILTKDWSAFKIVSIYQQF